MCRCPFEFLLYMSSDTASRTILGLLMHAICAIDFRTTHFGPTVSLHLISTALTVFLLLALRRKEDLWRANAEFSALPSLTRESVSLVIVTFNTGGATIIRFWLNSRHGTNAFELGSRPLPCN